MPFGLRSSAQHFQRFIDQVLRGLDFANENLDNSLVARHNAKEHKHHLNMIFASFNDHSIAINPDKCEFGVHSLEFLGHCHSSGCFQTQSITSQRRNNELQ